MTFAGSKGVTWVALSAATIGRVGFFAERVEGLALGFGLVVEVACEALGADAAGIFGLAEGILSLSADDAVAVLYSIAGVAGRTGSVAEIFLAERVDGNALVIVAEVVP